MSNNYFIYNGRLASLNDYISACRKHPQAGANFKREWQTTVEWAIKQYKNKGLLRAITKPCIVKFTWTEKTSKRDLDNISSFGRKIILDGLVDMMILPNDTQKWVRGFTDTFYKGDEDLIRVEIEEMEE